MALAEKMDAGDIIIDGGNSYYKDDVRRAKTLRERGLRYVDIGTSGGIWGVERGYCLMIGGGSAVDVALRALSLTTRAYPCREGVVGDAV
jgi:6-phosphogluconate dehydrogenase